MVEINYNNLYYLIVLFKVWILILNMKYTMLIKNIHFVCLWFQMKLIVTSSGKYFIPIRKNKKKS